MKGEVDNDRQHKGTGDANKGRIDINFDCRKGARGKGDDTNDDSSLSHGLCFYFEGKFHALPIRSGKKNCQGLE